jgi:hypothetical protein
MKKFEFHFSLHQMIILSIINKFQKLEDFFPKILIENKFEEKITINNEFFIHFDEKYFSEIFGHIKIEENDNAIQRKINPIKSLRLVNPEKKNKSNMSLAKIDKNLMNEYEYTNEKYNKFSLEIINPIYEVKQIFLFEIQSNKTQNIQYKLKIFKIPLLFNSDKFSVVDKLINQKKFYIFKEEINNEQEIIKRTFTNVKGKKSFSIRKSLIENNIKGTLGSFKTLFAPLNRSQTRNFNDKILNSSKKLSIIGANGFLLNKEKEKNISSKSSMILNTTSNQKPIQLRHKSSAKVSFFIANNQATNNNDNNNNMNMINPILEINKSAARKIKTSSFKIKD